MVKAETIFGSLNQPAIAPKMFPTVQERLGHRSITSTLIYTHLVNFEGDEYHVKTAKTLKEDEELLMAGFEYVTERDGVKIYRKRK